MIPQILIFTIYAAGATLWIALSLNSDQEFPQRCARVRPGHQAFADEEGVDLIVIATHGRTGLKHILMGSVAEKTVRLSRVPVLTVKPLPMREAIIDEEDVVQELHLR